MFKLPQVLDCAVRGLVGLIGEGGLPTHVINNDSNSKTMVW